MGHNLARGCEVPISSDSLNARAGKEAENTHKSHISKSDAIQDVAVVESVNNHSSSPQR
jgi:hypothetical protein